jgi:hypothetical protein
MRDTRYVLTRRSASRFERTDAAGFQQLDDVHRRWERLNRKSFFRDTFVPIAMPSLVMIALLIIVNLYIGQRRSLDPSPPQITRDAAAAARAQVFVRALGFEPGPAVCRAKRDGAAWCTIRVAGSDKTFALWCSDEHPTCIENMPRE